MRQCVSLCMIVRDEEENLDGCLDGLGGLFDEMIVIDTGSTDATKKIAERRGAKVFDFPWIDDFAAARNESRRHASGQWIFWLDADDRIDADNRRRLAELIEKLPPVNDECNPVFCMACNCVLPYSEAGVAVSHGRLFPNRADLAWSGRIHERIMPWPNAARVALVATDVSIDHDGYRDPIQRVKKIQRNVRLIEREYLLDPDDSVTLYYLARQRLWQKRHDECLRLSRRAIERDPQGQIAMTPQCYAMAADCQLKMRRPHDAVRTTGEGLRRFPENVSLLRQHGSCLNDVKRLDEAADCFRRVLKTENDKPRPAGMPVGRDAPIAHLSLGGIYRAQGKYADAERHFLHALALQPKNAEAHFMLGHLYLWLGRRPQAGECARKLESLVGAEYECAMLKGHACYYARDFGGADRWLQAAIALRHDEVYPRIVLGLALFQSKHDWERCREVLERVLELDPSQEQVRARLEDVKEVLAKKASRAAEAQAMAEAIPAGAMQIAGMGHASRLSYSC